MGNNGKNPRAPCRISRCCRCVSWCSSLLLLNTLIATLLTLIFAAVHPLGEHGASHLIGAFRTLTEVGRRLLWTRCGWPSPWRFGLLLLAVAPCWSASLAPPGWVGAFFAA